MGRAQLPALLFLLLLLLQVFLGVQPAPELDGRAESDSRRLRRLLLGDDHGAPRPPLSAPALDASALLVRSVHRAAPERALRRRLKRSEPLLSIDLSLELLRRMLEASRRQSQEAQAEENRRLMELVGK